MKRIIRIFSIALAVGTMASCADLDIPPKNILQNDAIFSDGGIEAYMVGLYRMIPMDDYNINRNSGDRQGYYDWAGFYTYETATGELIHRNGVHKEERPDYWSEGWKIIRNANQLLADLPAYVASLSETEQQVGNRWIAEAKFLRAYTYFQLARRYGGMPIIDSPQPFSDDFTTLYVARASCEQTYDFILKDLDEAIEGFGAQSRDALVAGRANRYVALAFKTRVAMTAASIAKYGKEYEFASRKEANMLLCGIPQGRANDYYQQAWKAAYDVEKSGLFELNGASATTPADKEAAFAGVWENADNNRESIFLRKYGLGNYVHSFGAVFNPPRMTSTYGDRYGVTLDWMELFDGGALDGRSDGKLNTTYEQGGKEYYRVYNNASALYEGMEPRLLASILVPGRVYKGVKIDLHTAVIKESNDPATPIERSTIPDDYIQTRLYRDGGANGWAFYREQMETFTGGEKKHQQPAGSRYKTSTGAEIYKTGLEGPHNREGNNNCNMSGIIGRKWIDLSEPRSIGLHQSTSSWVDIRYAEVLLNRAEAAIELFQGGNTADNASIAAVSSISYDGTSFNMQQDAFTQINAVRNRAGARLLASPAELSKEAAYNRPTNADASLRGNNPGKGGFIYAPNRGVQIVRVEHVKEMFMEHKVYWDYRRWFSLHMQIKDYRRRGVYGFLFAKGAMTSVDASNLQVPDGKYIYDIRTVLDQQDNINYDGASTNYYENVPQLSRNPLMEGNARQ